VHRRRSGLSVAATSNNKLGQPQRSVPMPSAWTASLCWGQLQGCAISIAYAVRYPERVTKLVLIGGFPRAATGAR
jgi:pimeloyl-ACP methyl ester carboxylesterase